MITDMRWVKSFDTKLRPDLGEGVGELVRKDRLQMWRTSTDGRFGEWIDVPTVEQE